MRELGRRGAKKVVAGHQPTRGQGLVEVDAKRTARFLESLPRPLRGQTEGIPGYPCYRTVEETLATGATLARRACIEGAGGFDPARRRVVRIGPIRLPRLRSSPGYAPTCRCGRAGSRAWPDGSGPASSP